MFSFNLYCCKSFSNTFVFFLASVKGGRRGGMDGSKEERRKVEGRGRVDL